MVRVILAMGVVCLVWGVAAQTPPAGSLSKDEIRGVIRAHTGEVKACYEASLAVQPELEGRVAVAFTIAPDGGVSEAKIAESTVDSEALDACLMDAVMTWTFPEPAGGGVVRVTYPFVFATQ